MSRLIRVRVGRRPDLPVDGEYNGYGDAPLYLPDWGADADATVSSWAAAESAYDGGARIIHLQAGNYGEHDWVSRPDVFMRNVPGEAVKLVSRFTSRVPNVTLAGVFVDGGRFEGRDEGDMATLYRSLLGKTGGGTFNALDSVGGVRGRWIEVHNVDAGDTYTGDADGSDGSDTLHINRGAEAYIDGCWLTGRTNHKGLVQNINGSGGCEIRNTWLGRGSSGSFSIHDSTPYARIHKVYFDWWPHGLGGGSGWQMRVDDPNLDEMTVHDVFAFRPRCDNNNPTTRPKEDWIHKLDFQGCTFYDIDTLGRNGDIMLNNSGESNATLNGDFPNNTFRADQPVETLPWVEPSWWGEFGHTGIVQNYPELQSEAV